MRGTNGPMDVITRAEFDDSMKDILTKTDFELRLADTKCELVSAMKQAVKENLDDLKVDILDAVETKVTKVRNLLALENVGISQLNDAKNEILATMRRNIGEAIAPLATKAEMELEFLKVASRLDSLDHKIDSTVDGQKGLDEKVTRFSQEIRETLEQHERQLDRHDADLYKLRQSGVLQ